MLFVSAVAHHVLDAGAVVPEDRSNRTISPAEGRRSTYRWKYHCARSRSDGAGKAATFTTRGLRYCVMRLMVPPLPAPSRPSKITATAGANPADPFLQLDQLHLEPSQLLLVPLVGQICRVSALGRCLLCHDSLIVAPEWRSRMVSPVPRSEFDQGFAAGLEWAGGAHRRDNRGSRCDDPVFGGAENGAPSEDGWHRGPRLHALPIDVDR